MADPEATKPCYTYDEHGTPLGTYPHHYRVNGHVSTQYSADFLYGVAAARMRFQRARGSHASFWLQPRGLLRYGTTPWGAEIDVVEWYGADDRRGGMTSAVYRPTPTGAKEQIGGRFPDTDSFLASRSDRWWRNYHVFSVEWTPTEYVFRIDGRETWRTSEGISHHPQFLILSQLTSDYELAANPDAVPQHTVRRLGAVLAVVTGKRDLTAIQALNGDPPLWGGPPVEARLPPKGHPPVSAYLRHPFCRLLTPPAPDPGHACSSLASLVPAVAAAPGRPRRRVRRDAGPSRVVRRG